MFLCVWNVARIRIRHNNNKSNKTKRHNKSVTEPKPIGNTSGSEAATTLTSLLWYMCVCVLCVAGRQDIAKTQAFSSLSFCAFSIVLRATTNSFVPKKRLRACRRANTMGHYILNKGRQVWQSGSLAFGSHR